MMRLLSRLLLLIMDINMSEGSQNLKQPKFRFDSFLADLEQLLNFGPKVNKDCTIVSIGEVIKTDMYPTLYVTPSTNISMPNGLNRSPVFRNTCYYIILESGEFSEERLLSMVIDTAKELNNSPALVVVISNNGGISSPSRSAIPCPWVTILNLRKVSIACPNCEAVKLGFWNHPSLHIKRKVGAFSKNFIHPVCCNSLEHRKFRITYLNWGSNFKVNDGVIDTNTYEGGILQSFNEKYKLIPELLDIKSFQNIIDKKTGLWTGHIGNVGYNRSDLGVSFLAPSHARHDIVDFILPILPGSHRWLCKAPGPVPPYLNLLLNYDLTSWIAILSSLLLVALIFLIIVRLGNQNGAMQPDTLEIMLTPLGMAVMELGEPAWINKRASGKIMFATWAMMGMVLILGYQCNLRALLLKVENEKLIDSTEDLIKSGKDIWLMRGWWHKRYLSVSENKWHIKVSKEAILTDSRSIENSLILIGEQGKACLMNSEVLINDMMKLNPKLKNLPKLHYSEETFLPYFSAWFVQKKSIWTEALTQHLLYYHQAGLLVKAEFDFFSPPVFTEKSDLKPLGMEHFMGPFIIWAIMMGVTVLIFCGKLLLEKLKSPPF